MRRIEDFAATRPDSPAVRAGSAVWTYRELKSSADALAASLRERSVGQGDRLGVLCRHGFEALAAMVAALQIGAAYVPIDPDVPVNRLAFLVNDSQMAYLLTHSEDLRRCDTFATGAVSTDLIPGLDLAGMPTGHPSGVSGFGVHPEALAYLIYTSGSTGIPKAVMVSRLGLANYLDWSAGAYADPEWIESLAGSSLAVDLTVTALFTPLMLGRCVVMLTGSDQDRWVRAIRHARGRLMLKVAPTQLKLVLASLTPDLAEKVAVLVLGGEALDWSIVERWRRLTPHTRVLNEYGPTETVVGCTVYEAVGCGERHGRVSIGRPIANISAHVLGASLEPVDEGELYIGGARVSHGYAQRPSATAERFVPDPYGAPGSRLYRTGDLVRTDNGVLDFIGRSDTQVKVRGHRVELEEIESVLNGYPDVAAAAVTFEHARRTEEIAKSVSGQTAWVRRFTKPEESGPELRAYLVLKNPSKIPAYVPLRAWLSERMQSHMIPSAFLVVSEFALLPSGKLDRGALARMASQPIQPSVSGDAPRNEPEAVLCEVVRNALGLAAVGIHDNFFEIGGDSIRIIGVHAQAREKGLSLELADFFKHQTIADLAREATKRQGLTSVVPARSGPFSLLRSSDRSIVPDEIEDAYPLARMQAGLVFHSLESQSSANYHDVFVYEIRSPFDRRALDSALAVVIDRHPALRTSFALTGFSEPLQLVHRHAAAEVEIHDLRAVAPKAQREALVQWIGREKNRAFAFAQPPLLRLHLHRTAEDVAHWGISFHDSILDGWSVATFLTELLTNYASALEGQRAPQSALHTTYRDFVSAERDALSDALQQAFWARYLEGRTAPLAEAQQLRTMSRVLEVGLPAELSNELHGIARLMRVSIKHVLLAAHVSVIGLISGQRDIVTGLESHGRLETEDSDRVLGMHLNTLPFRVQLPGGSWSSLIEAVRDGERATFPYRRYPYASIHKAHAAAGIFSSVFNYTHFHRLSEIAVLRGIEPIGGCGFGQRHYALSAEFNQDPYTNDLRLDLECNIEEGKEAYWQTVKDAYEEALNAIAADPFDRYDRLGIASDSRPVAFKADCDNAAQPTVVERWLQQVERHPDTIAVIDQHRQATYRDVYKQAASLADGLRAAGVNPGERVGIYLDASADQIAAMWSVLAVGGAYVALEPAMSSDRVCQILADSQVSAIISQRRLRNTWRWTGGNLQQISWVIVDDFASSPASDLRPRLHPEHIAYITYTSGSTGVPKGVRVSHATLAYSTAVRDAYYGSPDIRFICIPSLLHDSSVAVVFWTMCSGGTLVLPSYEDVRDPERLVNLIQRHAVTHWLSVPSLYAAVLRRGDESTLRSLRCAIVAGEACPSSVAALSLERCPAEMFNEYGPTEATVWATVYRIQQDVTTRPTVPIGQPIDGARVYVLDHHLRPVPLGVVGEIYIGGRGVSVGYGTASSTAVAFLPDPFAPGSGARMYRTGDLARCGANGEMEFIGRTDRQVKIRGYRIEPAEIEQVLQRIPGVAEAAVVAISSPDESSVRLAAYVVGKSSLDVTTLRRTCARHLPPPLVPSAFVLLDELPRLKNGKVDLRALGEWQPGLYEAGMAERLLARVEGMNADEAGALLRELAMERSA